MDPFEVGDLVIYDMNAVVNKDDPHFFFNDRRWRTRPFVVLDQQYLYGEYYLMLGQLPVMTPVRNFSFAAKRFKRA